MTKPSVKEIARLTERRLGEKTDTLASEAAKSSELPADYTRMVNEVFATNFDAGLKALSKLKPGARFESHGRIFPNEALVCVSLIHDSHLSATSVYASADYDPRASAPTIQDVLASCVDAIGTLFGQLLDAENPDKLEALADESLSALADIPFIWTGMDVDRRKVFIKVDKANPVLDQMADDWLAKHDPELKESEVEEQKETEKLFVTGPTKPESH